METDIIIQMGIIFFCIALLTFWFKKRWKKKPEPKARSYPENEVRGKWKKLKNSSSSEDWVGGKWTAEQPEPEPPERTSEPEPEPPERTSEPEPEPPERTSEPEPEPPEKEPKE
jgi:type IV secretory pathway VirB10-like protein